MRRTKVNIETKSLIKNIAKEFGLTFQEVERVYNAPFELQAIIMKYRCDRKKQIFPSLRIPYFLIFFCPEWTKKRLRKKYKDEDEVI